MKVYFSAKLNSFYPEEFLKDYKEMPTDLTEVPADQWVEFALNAPPLNKIRGSDENGRLVWVDGPPPSAEFLFNSEKEWVSSELTRARYELEKVQDSDPTARGTVGEWRSYRNSLRSWSDDINFPDKNFRPEAPDKG